MGIGAVGIDANESQQHTNFEVEIKPETTNIDDVVNYYFEIRNHLFPSQPNTQISTTATTNTGLNDVYCKTPPIPIPPPNYR